MIQRTLILVKHDGVLKGLVGEITRRFENMGMVISGMKMVWADDDLAENHYKVTDEWANALFERTKKGYESKGQEFPYTDPIEFGTIIKNRNVKFLLEGPVVAIVFEGPHSIELGRKLVGHTEPRQATSGTIRGDFSFESYQIADKKERPVRNLVHASGSVDEANREIELWFTKEELHTYENIQNKHL